MKKAIAVLVIIGVSFICGGMAFSQEAKEFELKLGTRKEAVGRKYGEPIMKEKIKSRFLPIPKEKALYKIDDSTYLILLFFSGRVNDMMVLDDVDYDEARTLFEKGFEE